MESMAYQTTPTLVLAFLPSLLATKTNRPLFVGNTSAEPLQFAPLILTLLWIHGWYVPMFTLLIFLLARCNGGPALFLQSAPMKLLGDASYSLYLFHWLPLGWLIHHYGVGGGPWWVSLLTIITLMGGSVAVHLGFEAPARLRILKLRSTFKK